MWLWRFMVLVVWLMGCGGTPAREDATPGDASSDVVEADADPGADATVPDAGDVGDSWAVRFGRPDENESIFRLAVGDDGTVFVLASVEGEPELETSAGTLTFPAEGVQDGLLLALDSRGTLGWSVQWGGDAAEVVVSDVAVAEAQVYVVGSVTGTVDLGDGSMPSLGERDAFLLALDAATGEFAWAMRFASTEDEAATRISVADDGALFIGGFFQGTASFGGAPLTSAGRRDVFVTAFARDRTHLWSSAFGAAGDDAMSAMDEIGGQVYVAGSFRGTVQHGTASATATLSTDAFVLTYAGATGSPGWLRSYPVDWVSDAAVNTAGDIAIVGSFSSAVDFGAGPVPRSSGIRDVYLLSLDPAGIFRWQTIIRGDAIFTGNTIASTAAGWLIGGTFGGTVDFGGAGTLMVPTTENEAFAATFDSDGTYREALTFGGPSTDGVLVVADDAAGEATVLGGWFVDTVAFGSTTLTAVGGPSRTDGFVYRVAR